MEIADTIQCQYLSFDLGELYAHVTTNGGTVPRCLSEHSSPKYSQFPMDLGLQSSFKDRPLALTVSPYH